MKYLPQFSPSLHDKLVIVTWLMFIHLLLLLCGIGSLIAVIYMKSALDAQNEAAIRNSQSILMLKTLVLKAEGVTGAYLVNGSAEPQNGFGSLNEEIETAYAGVYSAADTDEKRGTLNGVRQDWQQVKDLAAGVAGYEISGQHADPLEVAQQFNALRAIVIRLDNGLGQLYQVELADSRDKYERARLLDERTTPLILLLFITSLAINAVAIVFIIRAVVIPTHLLARAAHSYAQGSLSYRIPLDSNNEIGELARTFNYMAEKLESSYTVLKDMAIHDGLTGMLNHHEFHKRMLWEIKRAGRYQRGLSLLMMDIDRFKVLNDTYGHQAGDTVLKAVGEYLRNAIRSSDEAARYGGEEFALIMPETPADTAFITAQRIGAGMAGLPISIDKGMTVNVTLSIGVATFPQDAATKEELIAAADRRMYRAKNLGRNRVCNSTD